MVRFSVRILKNKDLTPSSYCLMPNHAHLVAVPRTEDGMRKAISEAHRRYARMINFREGW